MHIINVNRVTYTEINSLFEEAHRLKLEPNIQKKPYSWRWIGLTVVAVVAGIWGWPKPQPPNPMIKILDRAIEAGPSWDGLMELRGELRGAPRLSMLSEDLSNELLVAEVTYLPISDAPWWRELLLTAAQQ